MAKAQEAEPDERAASSPPRPRRQHVINLCCAQSVHRVVEEAARNLEELGFQVAVVCGAEARAALLGSHTDSNQPTIHVVCVQGSMQERVLKPLRQALASHGGPNHHLFVAVLDLEVPLAMVGQIRRFAEGLEGGGPLQGLGLDRATPRDQEMLPTRTYPSVARVPERPGTKPPIADDGEDRPRRSRSLGARGRAAKVAPTAKYQAITASHPIVPQNDTRVHKRRRERSHLVTSAGRPVPASRVLGLPEDVVREDSGPLPPREATPPPPPTGQTRRRSSTTLPSVSASPPPPPSRPLEPAGARGRAPEASTGAATPSLTTNPGAVAPEPDRLRPRTDAGFRFTPPGVKKAEERPVHAGAVTRVPLSEVLGDADRTVVHGVLEEVPRTASTLRLDEPPFQEGARDRRASADGDEAVEPVEPTMIMMAPGRAEKTVAGPAPVAEKTVAGPAPAAEKTVVGPAPAAERTPAPGPAPVAEKTVVGPAPVAEKTVVGPAPTLGETVVGPSPAGSPNDAVVSESAKTLLRSDGAFESAQTVLQKAQAARSGMTKPETGPAKSETGPEIPVEGRPHITLEPEDRVEPEEDGFKPKKTALYADSVGAEPAPPSAASVPSDGPMTWASAAASTDAVDAAPAVADAASAEPREPRKRVPSAIPTEKHEAVAAAPERRGPSRTRRSGVTTSEARSEQVASSPPRTRARRSSSSRYGWLWTLLVLLAAGVGWGSFQAGLFDGLLGRSSSSDTTIAQAGRAAADGGGDDAAPAGDTKTPALAATSEPDEPSGTTSDAELMATGSTGDPQTSAAGSTAAMETGAGSTEAEPEDGGSTGEPLEASGSTGQDDGTVAVASSAGSTDDGPGIDDPEPTASDPAVKLSADERRLGIAVDERRIYMLKTLFTTKRTGPATTFAGGWQRCAKLDVDGIKGWRLPHRREMKLVNAVLSLPAGDYWTRTVPDEDEDSAYVLDSSTGALSLSAKQEPTGEVVCVRRREFPER
ncbi:hypothetical protein [Paraliomyxa miuraensis]|uniref:hypothetical protein n=1 Tax=Paraliomyxa miuraensis TaxID=376150 RepID=UPI002252F083|nr:hypothetical protein [Paraliomyxa miuraensis]MCX4243766.1 hypothetical protein [Paraliomyxa miuraensis]